MEELEIAVQKAYNRYETRLIEDNFITQQKCVESAMHVNGSNNYQLQHLKKRH